MPLDQNPHQAVIRRVRRLFNACAPSATILLVYIPANIKMSLMGEDDFFLAKSASSVSEAKTRFPSVVQAYTQPYLFGGRIKLIICQIRQELSVTIHEISTS